MKFLLIFVALTTHTINSKAQADELAALKKVYERPESIPYLPDNAHSPIREKLGWMLFFDPRLSGSGVMSCASCHNPSFSWGDGLAKGVGQGHRSLGRRTPFIQNLAWTGKMMWDGRLTHLEGQALGPIGSEAEMNMNLDLLPGRIQAIPGYARLFAEAYPGEEITKELIGKAIAVYERGLISAPAPFDDWIAGQDNAISEEARKGFIIFNGKAACVTCHSGWRFTDDSFQDIGLKSDDIGRGKFLRLQSQQYAFKTPGLRNIAGRAPYMHDGSEATLEDVVEFYNRGGDVKRDSVSPLIRPLQLTAAEKRQLVEFLKTLTGREKPVTLPPLPR